jgi:hypothetical protein
MERDINTYRLVDYIIIFYEVEIGSREINNELEILVSAKNLLDIKSLRLCSANARPFPKVYFPRG